MAWVLSLYAQPASRAAPIRLGFWLHSHQQTVYWDRWPRIARGGLVRWDSAPWHWSLSAGRLPLGASRSWSAARARSGACICLCRGWADAAGGRSRGRAVVRWAGWWAARGTRAWAVGARRQAGWSCRPSLFVAADCGHRGLSEYAAGRRSRPLCWWWCRSCAGTARPRGGPACGRPWPAGGAGGARDVQSVIQPLVPDRRRGQAATYFWVWARGELDMRRGVGRLEGGWRGRRRWILDTAMTLTARGMQCNAASAAHSTGPVSI